MDFHLSLELILLSLTVLSGLILLFYFFKGKKSDENDRVPLLLDYSKSFFPILLIVIVVRSFVAEPFRIPSGSMIPTLEVGDFVLVQKYAYGLRLPVFHKKIFSVGQPSRGDVVVFRYPPNPKVNYIKRLIGLPGDVIEWTNDKKLIINGERVIYNSLGKYQVASKKAEGMLSVTKLEENLPDTENSHELIIFPGTASSGQWTVPENSYFVMGDNRDNSSDSRFWKFVPEENLVGKATLIWMHWDWSSGGDGFKPSRIGTSIQ